MSSGNLTSERIAGESPKHVSGLPVFKLTDGNEIPSLGFGFGSARYKADRDGPLDQDTIQAGILALKTGFYHLDAAEMYGNEKEVGLAIRQSGVARENLYITTKYNNSIQPFDIAESFALSLSTLGLEYVDQYLIHEPFFANGSSKTLQDAWVVMESIHASGKARSIGVSNFLQKDIEAVLETAKVIPAINQIEYHPYLQHGDLLAFHNKHGIATSAFSPLAAVTRAAPGPLDGMYATLAEKYGVSTGDIALRWVVDQGIVAITTSTNEERLKGYLNIGSFKLTLQEIEDIKIKGLEKNFRGFWADKFAEGEFC